MKKIISALMLLMFFLTLNVSAAKLKIETSDGYKVGFEKKITIDIVATEISDEEIKDIEFKINYSQLKHVKLVVNKGKDFGMITSSEVHSISTDTKFKNNDVIATIELTNLSESSEQVRSTLKLEDVKFDSKDNKDTNRLEIYLEPNKPKSDNAVLSKLIISSGKLTPSFNRDVNDYKVFDIKDTINAITIGKECQNCDIELKCEEGCNVSGSSRINLVLGKNVVNITSISESRKNKVNYTLTLYRGETKDNSSYLDNLEVEGYPFEQIFNKNKLDYNISVPYELTEANIIAVPEDTGAKIEIKGNENLIVGENIITITVKSSQTNDIKIYNITLVRLEEDEAIASTSIILDEPVKKSNNKLILIIVFSILTLGTGAYFIFFHKKVLEKLKQKKELKENATKAKEIEDTLVIETKELSIDEALEDIEKSKESLNLDDEENH